MSWKPHIFLDISLSLSFFRDSSLLGIGISPVPFMSCIFFFSFFLLFLVQYFSTSERWLAVSSGSALPGWGEVCSLHPRTHPWNISRNGNEGLRASPPHKALIVCGGGKAGFWQPGPIRALFLVPRWKDDIPLLAAACLGVWHQFCGRHSRPGHFCLGWFCFIPEAAQCWLPECPR